MTAATLSNPLPIRTAAQKALAQIEAKEDQIALFRNLFYGISLGSILLLAALGLAITFGLMGVINMAHGEMLMLGAYSTYVVQNIFKDYLPLRYLMVI
jgi:urea transport system permease protein